MTKRLTIAALCFLAGLALLLFLQRGPSSPKEDSPASGKRARIADAEPGSSRLEQSPDRGAGTSSESVSIEFDSVPLPEVLNQLVKQAGITVTADLDEIHRQTLVTVQAFVPPLEALKMVAETYELELLETNAGLWLRPVPPIVQVTYQPSITVDEKRTQQLLENLRKIIGAGDESSDNSTPPAVSIAIDPEGIHVTASPQRQTSASAYLETCFLAWGGKVTAKRAETVISADPPALQK